MTTPISPPRFRAVILLAGIGSVAPYLYAFYHAISLFYQALRSQSVALQFLFTHDLGFRQFLAPLAWAVFFLFLYGRVAGWISARGLRIAASVALLLMATGTVLFAREGFAILRSIPGATGDFHRILIAQLALYLPIFLCWCLLFAVFAVLTDPLVRRLTSRLALVTLALTLIQGIWSTYGILTNWFHTATAPISVVRVALAAVQIAGLLLVCLFLVELSRGFSAGRRSL
jgi:hypothetical protein